jgi:hypothetical protein
MAQAAEIQGIVAALEPVLRAARSAGYGIDPVQDLRVSVWVQGAGAAGAALVFTADDGASGHVDITPAEHDDGPVAALAEAVRPAVARLEAMALGTGLAAFALTVRHVADRDGAPRLEVARAVVEGFDVVEATETWSWQNRFREPEAAALAIALVMSALAEADAGTDLGAMTPLYIHLPDAPRIGAETWDRRDERVAVHGSTGIERALQRGIEVAAADMDHARRRFAAWLRGMRRATGRPEFHEDRAAAAVVSPSWSGAEIVSIQHHVRLYLEGDKPPLATPGHPVAAAE